MAGNRSERRGRLARLHIDKPPQLVALAFAGVIATVAVLLTLPVATESGEGTALLPALFTATSAVCVTGLVVVDTPTYFSTFGELVVLAAIQVGGFGIMTLSSLLGLLVFRRLGLRSRMTAAAETKALGIGDVRRVLRSVLGFSAFFESIAAVVLTLRWLTTYDESFGRAAYLGVFHAVSAFNNAGFALFTDSMIGFRQDPVISLTLCGAVIAGGIGFPVLYELRRELRIPRNWTVHTRITLWATAALLVLGTSAVTAIEWGNPETLGRLGVAGKLLAGFFLGVMPRTAGFNNIDYADADPATLLVTDILMFIGGGSASTAGGIKVTTFALLAFVMYAEVRASPEVHVGGRTLPRQVQRQALTIALFGVGLVVGGTLLLLVLTGLPLDVVLFEVTSAFATVGLSTGITADLPGAGQLLLIALMFLGRLGPITLASALALRSRPTLYRLPEERPIVG
ncbi:MAG: TrkH family potassium uptake protein [Mycobacteriales bacterium]